MWTCPKCGRSFQKQNQGHYCGEAPKTVEEYIKAQPEEVQKYLEEVRKAIRKALPNAKERISWSMPTFWDGQNIIQFAGFQRHIGLYPGPKAVEHFAEKLVDYKTNKGTIQLPYQKPLPIKLIEEIAVWCQKTGNHP